MPYRPRYRFFSMLLAGCLAFAVCADVAGAQESAAAELTFEGHELALFPGELTPDGATDTRSARLCLAVSETCVSAPEFYGLDPRATIVELGTGESAVLFSATASGGGSGQTTARRFLDIADGRFVALSPVITTSEQGEFAIWHGDDLPSGLLVVTADYVWGPGETHFSAHRYRIHSYGLLADGGDGLRLALRDEYTTAARYPGYDQVDAIDVLGPERQTILARLTP